MHIRVFLISVIIILVCGHAFGSPNQAAALFNEIQSSKDHRLNSGVIAAEVTRADSTKSAQSLTVSMSVEKSAFLAGEKVNINLVTNLSSTHVLLKYAIGGGVKTDVADFTFDGTYTYTWESPDAPGQVNLICEADSTIEETRVGITYIAVGKSLIPVTYTYTEIVPVDDSATCSLRLYGRSATISGDITTLDGLPIKGALITFGRGGSCETDGSGQYKYDSCIVGSDYILVGQIPTSKEIVTVEAVACKTASKNVDLPAEGAVTGCHFKIERAFLPAGIDPEQFNLKTFNWDKSRDYSVWQDILGITTNPNLELQRIVRNGKQVSPPSFNLDEKILYLIQKPGSDTYNMVFTAKQDGKFQLWAAATTGGKMLQTDVIKVEAKVGEQVGISAAVKKDRVELSTSMMLSLPLLIIPTVIGIIFGGGLAFLAASGRLKDTGKLASNLKTINLFKRKQEKTSLNIPKAKAD